MPRAVWTGSITFGLVTIPARLYPATEPKDVRFHLTDARGHRVRYRRFVAEDEPGTAGLPSEEDGPGPEEGPPDEGRPPPAPEAGFAEKEIAFEDLMRGYETDDGGVVVLGRDEIGSVRPEPSRTIEIEDFVDLADIDPVFFEKSYVVAPQRGAEKPYALLLLAMQREGRVGIGRFVLRTKPHLVAIRPGEDVLVLETLFFGDEVRDGRALVGDLDAVDVSDREVQTAQMLIETLNTRWNPASYSDTYREELLRKINEKEPIAPAEERGTLVDRGSRVDALMQALQESVEAAKRSKRKSSKKRPA